MFVEHSIPLQKRDMGIGLNIKTSSKTGMNFGNSKQEKLISMIKK